MGGDPRPARDFFQGLIQVSVAYYHLGNGNAGGGGEHDATRPQALRAVSGALLRVRRGRAARAAGRPGSSASLRGTPPPPPPTSRAGSSREFPWALVGEESGKRNVTSRIIVKGPADRSECLICRIPSSQNPATDIRAATGTGSQSTLAGQHRSSSRSPGPRAAARCPVPSPRPEPRRRRRQPRCADPASASGHRRRCHRDRDGAAHPSRSGVP